ncbi:uncharacterized protein LOC141537983 [Cotesia typhae]|uniref:uncharacterized protein LOC141537983 n=1 Tax=Cotesia typhae TaxID=2053667 RepID=UPI003D69D780
MTDPVIEKYPTMLQNISHDTLENHQQSSLTSLLLLNYLDNENDSNKNIINQPIHMSSTSDKADLTTEQENPPRIESSLPQTMKLQLAKCFVENKLNQTQINAILKVLRIHPQLQFLPENSRSLMSTPRDKVAVKEMPPGEYLQMGLEKMLRRILDRVPSESIPEKLLIDFSTDGAELNKEIALWLIQFRVVNLQYDKPELLGIYKGDKKPQSFTNFFAYFVNEVKDILKKGGIEYKKRKIPIELRCFIADAPARSSVLNHRGHTSKFPCSKCCVEGSYSAGSNRFPGVNHKSRTDADYRVLKDVDHHEGKSALDELPIDLVHQVPFDYMHLVCLGVMKKTVESVVFGKCALKKLPCFKVTLLSNRLMTLQLYCPREFARIPRELDKLSNFKATEFRQLLLYTFIVVFRGIISDEQYNHFLLLHSSMRVLLNSSSPNEMVDFAEESLKSYVIKAQEIYGLRFLTYNAHGLVHLPADYRLYGSLDSVSAFSYENKMPVYRGYVRKPNQPLQQIHKRVHEELQFPVTPESKSKTFKASVIHDCGPIPAIFTYSSLQYENLQTPSFYFSIQNNDNTIITKDGKIGVIKNVISYNSDYYFAIHFFEKLEPFYMISNQPSSQFGVYLCTSLNDTQAVIITYNEIASKCYRMPLWINKQFYDRPINDKQLNNAYVSVSLSCSLLE